MTREHVYLHLTARFSSAITDSEPGNDRKTVCVGVSIAAKSKSRAKKNLAGETGVAVLFVAKGESSGRQTVVIMETLSQDESSR